MLVESALCEGLPHTLSTEMLSGIFVMSRGPVPNVVHTRSQDKLDGLRACEGPLSFSSLSAAYSNAGTASLTSVTAAGDGHRPATHLPHITTKAYDTTVQKWRQPKDSQMRMAG
jgi:hypothetical protein